MARPELALALVEDNAWVINFSEGYNIDPKLSNTMEGDLEGLLCNL